MTPAATDSTRWFVTSSPYRYHEVVLEDGSGPDYDVCDYAEVEAPTRREAVKRAVADWLAERGDTWPKTQRADGRCPYTGVRAISFAEAKAGAKSSPPSEPGDWVWNDDDIEWGWYDRSECRVCGSRGVLDDVFGWLHEDAEDGMSFNHEFVGGAGGGPCWCGR